MASSNYRTSNIPYATRIDRPSTMKHPVKARRQAKPSVEKQDGGALNDGAKDDEADAPEDNPPVIVAVLCVVVGVLHTKGEVR